MNDLEKLKTIHSEEYKKYLAALCKLACTYTPRTRLQFAQKAYDCFQDLSIRRLVLAYGEERDKLDASRLGDFEYASENPSSVTANHLDDFCLNHTKSYGDSILMLFGVN